MNSIIDAGDTSQAAKNSGSGSSGKDPEPSEVAKAQLDAEGATARATHLKEMQRARELREQNAQNQ